MSYALSDALPEAVERIRDLLPELRRRRSQQQLPHVTKGGRWQWLPALSSGHWRGEEWHHGSWTGGFVAGQLWQASLVSDSPHEFLDEAQAIVELLEPRSNDKATHDVGFLFWPSAVLGYQITSDPVLRDVALQAAKSLLSRVHPAGFIQSWGELSDLRARGSSAIDTMMNLPLLWWAAKEGLGEAAKIAESHTRIMARAYVRPDGTTYHIVRFGDDGRPLHRGTFQGYSHESCWSRGQAWAIAGLVDAYRMMREDGLLNLAAQCSQVFIDRLSETGIPPWDFDDSQPNATRDASAAAIVAVALFKLAETTGEHVWRKDALHLTQSLVDHAMNRDTGEGILLLSTYSVPHREGVEGATTWGDYFFLAALTQALFPDRYVDPLDGMRINED